MTLSDPPFVGRARMSWPHVLSFVHLRVPPIFIGNGLFIALFTAYMLFTRLNGIRTLHHYAGWLMHRLDELSTVEPYN